MAGTWLPFNKPLYHPGLTNEFRYGIIIVAKRGPPPRGWETFVQGFQAELEKAAHIARLPMELGMTL